MSLVRFTALLGLTAGLALAGSYVPSSIPSDAVAYHIPISSWFGRGDAWPHLPNHIWTAQWPLASSLWSSFVMGRPPVTDRLVAWSAQNYAFIVWTASLVFAAIKSLFATDRRRDLTAWLVSLSLLIGAYSGYERLGFVDYRAGLFAAALIATLVEIPVSFRTVPLAVVLASTLAEFRPQGLLFALMLLLCWLGLSLHPSKDRVTPPVGRGRGRGVLASVMMVFAGLVFAKWWLLVWIRWGSPAPPIFARRWNLSSTQKYADELFYYLWTADVRKGLKLLFPGSRDTLLLAFLLWVLLLLATMTALRGAGTQRQGNTLRYRLIGLSAILSPVAACAFLATRVPSEAPRMMAPIVPACCIFVFSVLRCEVHALDNPLGKRSTDLFPWLFLVVSLLTAPFPWDRPHAGRTYPSWTMNYFSQVEEQLNKLRDRRPLVFDQYIAFLPVEFKQMGVTYGPWASMPTKPLRSLDTWMQWLRDNNVGTLVVQEGKEIKATWEWTQERTETPDFGVLARWVENCPDREIVGAWIACPVPSPSPGD